MVNFGVFLATAGILMIAAAGLILAPLVAAIKQSRTSPNLEAIGHVSTFMLWIGYAIVFLSIPTIAIAMLLEIAFRNI